MRAHQLKQCNNFKDPGVQHYGNTEFVQVRDDADDIFSALPPPTKSAPPVPDYHHYGAAPRSAHFTAAPSTLSMASFNDRSRGCFHADSQVSLFNGTFKRASQIVKGDQLNSGGKVLCVVKTSCRRNNNNNNKMQMIRLPGSGLLITPYHPVYVDNRWQFPIDCGEWIAVDCADVFSFVVESGTVAGKMATSALINNVPTAMLAHGVMGTPVLSHSFFGTQNIINALKLCYDYETGLVVFEEGEYFTRDVHTNDVNGINAALAIVH